MPRSKTRKDKKRNRKGRKTMRGGANTVQPGIRTRITALEEAAADKPYIKKTRSSIKALEKKNRVKSEHFSIKERPSPGDNNRTSGSSSSHSRKKSPQNSSPEYLVPAAQQPTGDLYATADTRGSSNPYKTPKRNDSEEGYAVIDPQVAEPGVEKSASQMKRKAQLAEINKARANKKENTEGLALNALEELDAYLDMKAASNKKKSSEVATVIRNMDNHARKVLEQKLAQEVAPKEKRKFFSWISSKLGKKKKSSTTRKNVNLEEARLYGGKH